MKAEYEASGNPAESCAASALPLSVKSDGWSVVRPFQNLSLGHCGRRPLSRV